MIRPEHDVATPGGPAPDEPTAAELWAAGVAAVTTAEEQLADLYADLAVVGASVRALLALARRTLDDHQPHHVCGTDYCVGCQIDAWPCAHADQALRAVGVLPSGTTTVRSTL